VRVCVHVCCACVYVCMCVCSYVVVHGGGDDGDKLYLYFVTTLL